MGEIYKISAVIADVVIFRVKTGPKTFRYTYSKINK